MTAAHCVLAGGLTWQTAGTSWGTGVQADPGRDTFLMRSAIGSSFNTASAWVGTPTTTDLRWVFALEAAPMVGDTVWNGSS